MAEDNAYKELHQTDSVYNSSPWSNPSVLNSLEEKTACDNSSSCNNRTTGLFLLDGSQYTVPLNGYFTPVVVLFTIITNLLVCAVLLSRNMRTATNTLLVAMALSDMVTGESGVTVGHGHFRRGYR